MSEINTNMSAVSTLYQLQKNNKGLEKAMSRIASGERITNAGDDAAGAAIVNRMTSQIRGLETAIRNAGEAISLAQTAEGALNEVAAILQRIRELSIQSANGIYGGSDRQNLNAEVRHLQAELQRISDSTYFNETPLLNGTFQDMNFQIGYQNTTNHSLTIDDISPSEIGEYTISTSKMGVSYATDNQGNFIAADNIGRIEPKTGFVLDGEDISTAQLSVFDVDYGSFNPQVDEVSVQIDGVSNAVDLTNVIDGSTLARAIKDTITENADWNELYNVAIDSDTNEISISLKEENRPFDIAIIHNNNAVEASDFRIPVRATPDPDFKQVQISIDEFAAINFASDTLTITIDQEEFNVSLGSINSKTDLADAIRDTIQDRFINDNDFNVSAIVDEDDNVILTGNAQTPFFTAELSFSGAPSAFSLATVRDYAAPYNYIDQTLLLTGFENLASSDELTFTYRGTEYEVSSDAITHIIGSNTPTIANMATLTGLASSTQDIDFVSHTLTFNAGDAANGDTLTVSVNGTDYTSVALASTDNAALLNALRSAENSAGQELSEVFTITQAAAGTYNFTAADKNQYLLSLSSSENSNLEGTGTAHFDLRIDGTNITTGFLSAGDRLTLSMGSQNFITPVLADANNDDTISLSELATALQDATLADGTDLSDYYTITAASDTINITADSSAPNDIEALSINLNLGMSLSRYGVNVSGSGSTLTFANSQSADRIALDTQAASADIDFAQNGDLIDEQAQTARLTIDESNLDTTNDTLTITIDGTSINLDSTNWNGVTDDATLASAISNAINSDSELSARLIATVDQNDDVLITARHLDNRPAQFDIAVSFAENSNWIMASDNDVLTPEVTAWQTGHRSIATAANVVKFNQAGIDVSNDRFQLTFTGVDGAGNDVNRELIIDIDNPSNGIYFTPGNPVSSQDLAELAMLEINNDPELAQLVQARIPNDADYSNGTYVDHLDEVIIETLGAQAAISTSIHLLDSSPSVQEDTAESVAHIYAPSGESGVYISERDEKLDKNFHRLYVDENNRVTHYRIADSGQLINENDYVVAVDGDGRPTDYLVSRDGELIRPGDFAIVDSDGNQQQGFGIPQRADITARTPAIGARLQNHAAAATPHIGMSAIDAHSRIIDAEDLTIIGVVGSADVDITTAMTAGDIADTINNAYTRTGVSATAKTEVQISFEKLTTEDYIDSVGFKLYGRSETPISITAAIHLGGAGDDTQIPRAADLSQLHGAINDKYGTTGISAYLSDDKQSLRLVSEGGDDIIIEDYGLINAAGTDLVPRMKIETLDEDYEPLGDAYYLEDNSAPNAQDSMRITGQVTFHAAEVFTLRSGTDGRGEGGMFVSAPGAATLTSISQMDILTVDNARRMLSIVDGALTRVDMQRGELGATMNRMEYTINNLSNIVVNTKASRSRIGDADIAAETAALTRAQVLQQAAQAILAQANQSAQSILSLLQ